MSTYETTNKRVLFAQHQILIILCKLMKNP